MNVRDFDFELPPERIAQRPLAERDRSRLLVLDRASGRVDHRRFDELTELLDAGDLLVLNDTRVIPARLVGRKASGGRVELLLVEPTGAEGAWECLIQASRTPPLGSRLKFEGGLVGEVGPRRGDRWEVRFRSDGMAVGPALVRAGRVPLPPYVRRPEGAADLDEDREGYQTVYAERPGAVAAPTAGLHFTERLLERLEARGVQVARLTLHVGPGTFLPLRVERVEDHRMHEERFDLPRATTDAVARARRRGGRVVAVGSTVVRTLEHRATDGGRVLAGRGRCELFIYPGFRFQVVDAMITNFHLPRSTLLLLVCAFAGREQVLGCYREALERGYRFYSYGDAMLVR